MKQRMFYRWFILVCICSLLCGLLWVLQSSSSSSKLEEAVYLDRSLSDIRPLIQPKCDLSSKLIVIITSKSSHLDLRRAQRSVIPNIPGVQQRVFLLALDSSVANSSLHKESSEYGDILLGDFYEEYHRLSYKHGMGLLWVASHCGLESFDNNRKYVLKMDDDIMVRVDRILKELPYIFEDRSDQFALAGYIQSNLKPSRKFDSKWFTKYPWPVYPDFLSGWAYIATQGAVRVLAASMLSESHDIFWIDDVWITGILANQHLGLKLKSLNRFFAEYRDYIDNCCFIDMSLECMYWIGPSEGSLKALKNFGQQCVMGRCSEESIVNQEPRRLRDCSIGPCLREASPPTASNKMSCLSKYANPFRLPHSRGVGQVIPL